MNEMKLMFVKETNHFFTRGKVYDVFYCPEENNYQIIDDNLSIKTVDSGFIENNDMFIKHFDK